MTDDQIFNDAIDSLVADGMLEERQHTYPDWRIVKKAGVDIWELHLDWSKLAGTGPASVLFYLDTAELANLRDAIGEALS